eukprot:4791570-Pleurochrysis_carterae.AAC.2
MFPSAPCHAEIHPATRSRGEPSPRFSLPFAIHLPAFPVFLPRTFSLRRRRFVPTTAERVRGFEPVLPARAADQSADQALQGRAPPPGVASHNVHRAPENVNLCAKWHGDWVAVTLN